MRVDVGANDSNHRSSGSNVRANHLTIGHMAGNVGANHLTIGHMTAM